jgi:hypothetical protein
LRSQRSQPLPCHRNTFFATCWLIVEPPRSRLPSAALRSIASPIASSSNPEWLQNFESSAAIAAATMLRSMRLSGVQSLVKPFGSASMVIVRGGGTKR